MDTVARHFVQEIQSLRRYAPSLPETETEAVDEHFLLYSFVRELGSGSVI